MQTFAFFPIVDLPLILAATIGFVVNFRLWADSASEDIQPQIKSRLSSATIRVVGFFVALLVLCWSTNIAVWAVFCLVFVIALCGMFLSPDAFGLDLAVLFAFGLLREWCFGFPQLILRPQADTTDSSDRELKQKLIGKPGITTSPLRPAGNVSIDGSEYPAASEDGTLIENGTEIVVIGTKNGTILVKDVC